MIVLALLLLWAALDVAVLVALNRWRDRLEEQGDGSETVVGWIERRGFVRMRPPTFTGEIRDGRVHGSWDDEEEQAS